MMNSNAKEEEEDNLLEEIYSRMAARKFYSITPYRWQEEFSNAGKTDVARLLMAANRVGKTFWAAYEVTCHMTGLYPDWWDGYRCKDAPFVWASSLTNQTSRGIIQKELLGEAGQYGTGTIPGDLLSNITTRQAGFPDVVDTFRVKHVSGKYSVCETKVAEQGWQKYQGTAPVIIWQDEEPNDFKIITEMMTRIITSKGRLLITFTPLMGQTEMVNHFQNNKDKMSVHTATWDDAEHLSTEDKKTFLDIYPEHERKTRSKGIPMMGQGAVFPIDEELIKVEPFKIPDHWPQLIGVDFGLDHPAAGCKIAYDVDSDTVYITWCYKKANQLPSYHVSVMRHQGDWIPIAWPHDGVNDEKRSGENIKDAYLDEGARMLPMSARYKDDVGSSQAIEPIIMEFYTRMEQGRLKVLSSCIEWFQEKRGLYRKDNVVKAFNDDVMKASFYAVMMKRYALPKYMASGRMHKKSNGKPLFSSKGH